MGKREKGYLINAGQDAGAYFTVYAVLCIALLLSLCLTLIEGSRRNGARLQAECVTDIGLHSIMAEYHRELMKQYNLFAIDASYGTDLCSKANTEAHLRKYVEKNLDFGDVLPANRLYGDFLQLELEESKLTKVSILTDDKGAVFRKYAAEAMRADVGLELLEQLQEWMQVIEVNGLEEGKTEEEKHRFDEEIRKYDGMEVEIQEDEWQTLEIANPTDMLEAKRRLGILRLVVEDGAEISSNALKESGLIEERMKTGQINQGNITNQKLSSMEELSERFFFQEYLLKYMGRYGEEKEKDVLRYQIEYLIGGKDSDTDNLKSVVSRLCLLREAANAVYLWTDETKRSEIRAAAAAVCTLILLPELTALLEKAIILGWAFAESIYDVRSLLAGGQIPLMKDKDSWHYGLTSALEGELEDATREGEGLGYEDYLRILMMLTDGDELTARAMNMVEADIRSTSGNSVFRLDGCYVELEAYLRFLSVRGSSLEITRQKKYN